MVACEEVEPEPELGNESEPDPEVLREALLTGGAGRPLTDCGGGSAGCLEDLLVVP